MENTDSKNNTFALVTGGSRGIGKAICIRLAQDGYNIIINYRSGAEHAQQVKEDVEKLGRKAELLPFDVSDSKATENAISQWLEVHKDSTISVLVNNAGIRNDTLLATMNTAQWHSVIGTTLDGFYNVTQPILKKMLRARNGRIINMASLSGMMGIPGQTNYSAAKAALIGATKALAKEVASRGITVNAVAPGFIETDMTEGLNKETLTQNIPAGRFGKPEEVAALVSFLAGKESAYLTGQVISINGGLYA
ncbi:MAG: 3-oxoacyl-ACP reductase FabG [Bacteroidales bacterium]|nr:3-oxoacyl-ACP reductase FabG [Bacteroidales bacterium]